MCVSNSKRHSITFLLFHDIYPATVVDLSSLVGPNTWQTPQ